MYNVCNIVLRKFVISWVCIISCAKPPKFRCLLITGTCVSRAALQMDCKQVIS